MEVISFLIYIGLGIVLTYFSVKAESPVFGLFGAMILLISGLTIMTGGLQASYIELTINETGNYTTSVVEQDLIDNTSVLDSGRFGLPIIGLAIYIFYASAMGVNEKRGKGKLI
jgi:hypothetical protein